MAFKGKIALVTGAGRGIGREIVKALVAEECAAVYALSRSKIPLETLKQECPSVTTIQCDLADWDETKAKVESIGHVDLLVNNAAVVIFKNFGEFSSDDLPSLTNINVNSIINVSQVVAKRMKEKKRGGAIVNISSVSGLRATATQAVYAATKAAVDQLTKVMALELGPHKIRVNTVNPTMVATEMGREFWHAPNRAEEYNELLMRIPLRRTAEVQEVVDPVLFLLSNKASMITGASIPIDGGLTAT